MAWRGAVRARRVEGPGVQGLLLQDYFSTERYTRSTKHLNYTAEPTKAVHQSCFSTVQELMGVHTGASPNYGSQSFP